LVIPKSIYIRGKNRGLRHLSGMVTEKVRNPRIIQTEDKIIFIVTGKEWYRIIKATKNSEVLEAYRWDQKYRFRFMKKRQKQLNEKAIHNANQF
jgi:hypothetical protein